MMSFPPKYLSKKTTALPMHGDRSLRSGLSGLMAFAAAALIMSSVTIAQAQTASLGGGGFVYTADEHGNSISAIDLAVGSVATVPIPVSPHNVQITADGMRLLAVGEPAAEGHGHGHSGGAHGGDETKGRLLVLDPTRLTNGVVDEIIVGAHPAHVVADESGERAFVTNAGDNTVSVVNLAAKKVIATIGTGRYPHGLRMSPDGREVYVANVEDGTVSVIDASSLTELARIPVGNTPVQVAFTPDGRRVYVSLRDDNQVAVVDTATRSLIATIDVGPNPIQVHATPDGRFVYVANQGTDAQPNDTVSVIEVATSNVVETVRTGKGAHGVAVSSDGALVFVTNIVDGTVSAIDVATREVIAKFSVGRGPNGITYRSPQG
jgi:YVTN family beta-propeller protein